MIEADKRKAIYLLHQEGMSLHEIARRFGISRNTIRAVIQNKGASSAPLDIYLNIKYLCIKVII